MLENIVTGPVEFKVDLCAYIISKKSTKNNQFKNEPCCLGLIQQVPTKIEAACMK